MAARTCRHSGVRVRPLRVCWHPLPVFWRQAHGCIPRGGERGGGVTCPNRVAGVGVVGRMGISRDGYEVVRVTVMFLEEGGVGKKSVSAGVRRQVAWMAGARIVCIRSWLMNVMRPLSLAVRTSSTGYSAGKRSEGAPSNYLCAGPKRMLPAGMWMRADILPWPLTAVEFHGVSSQITIIITTINRVIRCSFTRGECAE